MKSTKEIGAIALEAMVNSILRHVEDDIKAMRCDTSAIAKEHIPGFEAGFRACKRRMLELFEEPYEYSEDKK